MVPTVVLPGRVLFSACCRAASHCVTTLVALGHSRKGENMGHCP